MLFADIVGFTGLSEHLDPERVKRLVDDAFARLIGDIDAHGGSVDKVLGDGILALFGAPIAHEDDPDRAVRAALAMQQSLAGLGAQHGLQRPLEMRVGINTGEVLVGRVGGTDAYTATGDVVNVASRLQALAPPSGVYIGDSTASRLSGAIACEAVDEFEVRGRNQTERVWKVTGRQRTNPAVGARADVRFVGRADEQDLLASIMAMVAGGRSAVVAVTGEPGSGKTRLIANSLQRAADPNVVVLAGECAPYGETNVWAPIADALFRRMEFDSESSSERVRRLARDKGVEVYGFDPDDAGLDRFVEAVSHLAGHPSELDGVPPAQAREMLSRLIVEGIRRRSRAGQVVVWIDDLQWADPLLIDLLHRLTRSLVDRPVLVVTAQRDDAELDWPPSSDHPVSVRIPLEPLSRAEADELIEAAIGRPVSSTVAATLYERSGGNPLFLTELAELSSSEANGAELPSSLRALIASRLDLLPPTVRAIVDNAAVLGSSGPVSALETFAEVLGQRYTDDDLAELVACGYLEIDGRWWRFRSDLVRDVAYRTLTKTVRAYRHAGTAEVMAGVAGIPIERLAHHIASAAELVAEIGAVEGVPETIHDDAVDVLSEAARRALATGSFDQARRHATRALELGPSDPDLRLELLLVRARAHTERREGRQGRTDAGAVLEAAVDAGDLRREGIARRLLGQLAQNDGDLDVARRELDRSVEIFRSLGEQAELADSLAARGFVKVFGGSLADAETILGEAERLADELGDRRAGAWAREHQAWVAFLGGDPERAHDRLEAAAALFAELGDRAGGLWADALRAYLHFFERRFDDAEALAAQVRASSVELGERWAPAMMDSLVATLRLWSGRFSEAEALSHRALLEFRDIGDRFGILQALTPNMRSLAAMGRNSEAERGLEEALALSESFGDLAIPTMAAAGTAIHLGLGDRAVVLAESALEQVENMGGNAAESLVTLAIALCQVGRTEDALAALLDAEIDFPYGYAVRSLANAGVGDHHAAIADADATIDDPGATYLDRVYADIGGASGHVGRGEAAEALARLDRAVATAAETGDVVACSLASTARATLVGEGGGDEPGVLGRGWVRLIERLVEAS